MLPSEKQLGIDLEKENQRTPQEMLHTMTDALLIAAQFRIMTGETAAQMVELTRELLHWAFSKPGVHPTPAELLYESLMLSKETKQDSPGKSKLDA